MGLDIRWPIGLMFSLLGALLCFNGVRDHSDHTISLGVNINLIWGAVLLVFGVLMLLGAIAGKKNPPSN